MSRHETVGLPVLQSPTAGGVTGSVDIFERSNLTKSQLLIWTGQKLNPDAPLYNMVLAFTIDGHVDPGVFLEAFDAMVMSTDAMRTVIDEADGVPQQRVLGEVPSPTEFLDLSTAAGIAPAVQKQ